MATSSRGSRRATKKPPRSPARIAALVGVAALLLLLGFKLNAYLGSPAGRQFLERAGGRAHVEDGTALGLVEALEQLGIEPSAIRRHSAAEIITGKPEAERWTVAVPRQVALVECNLVVTRTVRRLGLEVQDAWEHRSDEGRRALSMSLATLGHGTGTRTATIGWSEPRTDDERYRLTFVKQAPSERGRLAIVIDDFGYNWTRTAREFLEFPAPITMAILPGYRSSRKIADAARARGYEVILHLPMEPEDYPRVKPGPEAILVDQKPAEVKATMRRALKSVGPVSGISNHMGSLATKDTDLMRLVLSEVDRLGLYFFDSRTTPQSVADRVALRLGTPCVTNRLFIDRDKAKEEIVERIDEAIEIAGRAHEIAVIGHPYPETLAALTEALPRIEEQEIRLVRLSEIVPRTLVE